MANRFGRYSRLNRLLLALPEGFLADSAWLQAQGLSRSSIRDYVDRGWLERVGPRVYRRPRQVANDPLRWDVVVLSLQQVMHKALHVGGRTAVELSGYAHYLEAGSASTVYLYGQGAPTWLAKLPSTARFELRSDHLFATGGTGVEMRRFDLRSGETSAQTKEAEANSPWEWSLTMSVPERAILEMMDELPHHESFHQVDVVMEGMANLRPQLLGNLLQECRSVKVKRLFLWYAERHGHSWLKHLDQSSIDLGLGKRQLVPAGRFDARYQITLPTELPDLDRHSVTSSIAGDRSRLSEPHCLFAGGRSVLVSDEEYLTETKLDANDNAAAESRLESTIMLKYPHRRRK